MHINTTALLCMYWIHITIFAASFFQIIGYSLLLAVIVAAFLTSCGCGWRKCCEKKFSCCSRKTLYYRLILEEEKKALDVLLRKAAKENLTKQIMTKIKKNDWDGCFNVAQEMINKAKQQKMAARNEDISKESTKTGEPAQQGTRSAHHEVKSFVLFTCRMLLLSV